MGYEPAYEKQLRAHGEVLAGRGDPDADSAHVLCVEHDPVITVTKRPDAPSHVIGSSDQLAAMGVEVAQTDRGGDVTYHGPGQLVCYPIVDLNAYSLRIHDYIRLLEQSIIDTLGAFGVEGRRDEGATGVWVDRGGELAKVAAIGVRVRKWVSLHGLALNVDPEMSHFSLIVPCGLAGRPVCSLRDLLGDDAPSMGEAQRVLVERLVSLLNDRAETRDAETGDAAGQYTKEHT